MNKDWMDAVREQCLSDGSTPAPGGWEAVGAKMRRAAARRRAVLAAVVAVPAVALFLWSPWRQPATPAAPVAQAPAPVIPGETIGLPDTSPAIPVQTSLPQSRRRPVPSQAPSSITVQNEDNVLENPDPSSKQAPDEDETVEIVLPSSKEAPNEDGGRILLAMDATKPRHRPKVSIGLRGSTGAVRRESEMTLLSAPYVATLMYLNNATDETNTLTNTWPSVKTNSANSIEYYAKTYSFFASSATARYRHDLPVSVGLTARLDVTPRFGLESGIEYTYLHSVATWENAREDQRLHFIGIPLRADVRLWSRKNFDLYVGAGGKVEKCVSASMGLVSCEEPRLQWSAEAFGGIQYQPWPRIHLYFQPALSWYLTKTDLPTYRTENPLGFSLHAGLRFDLSRN